jgi:hypothetical protein
VRGLESLRRVGGGLLRLVWPEGSHQFFFLELELLHGIIIQMMEDKIYWCVISNQLKLTSIRLQGCIIR